MDTTDMQGRTALHMAADAGLVGIVDALVKSGANVSIRDAQVKAYFTHRMSAIGNPDVLAQRSGC